jgi:hypothetical protein
MNRKIQRGRHSEFVDRNPRYYAMNDHPNYKQFGKLKTQLYMDEEGRQYRVATTRNVRFKEVMGVSDSSPPPPPQSEEPLRVGFDRIRLWVRLPPEVKWYPRTNVQVTLYPVVKNKSKGKKTFGEEVEQGDALPRQVTIREHFIQGPQHRTGHVHIPEVEWKR